MTHCHTLMLCITLMAIPYNVFCKYYSSNVYIINTVDAKNERNINEDGITDVNITLHHTTYSLYLSTFEYDYKIQGNQIVKEDILLAQEMLPYRHNLKTTFTKQGLFDAKTQTTPGMVAGLGSGFIDIVRCIEGKLMLKRDTKITRYEYASRYQLTPVDVLVERNVDDNMLDIGFSWGYTNNSSTYSPQLAYYVRAWNGKKNPTHQEVLQTLGILNLCDSDITVANKASFRWYALQHIGILDVNVETRTVEKRDIWVERRSFLGPYLISMSGHPLNPMGATGIIGLGQLYRYGPNHAADLLLYRYKKNPDGTTLRPLTLEGAFITRREKTVFAFVGGFVDGWDIGDIWLTIVHELFEEAFDCLKEEAKNAKRFEAIRNAFDLLISDYDKTKAPKTKDRVEYVLPRIHVVFQGYSDDKRNTDNAWIETTLFAVNVDGTDFNEFLKPKPETPSTESAHLPEGSVPEEWKYWQAGDGASGIHWKPIREFLTQIKGDEENDTIAPKDKRIMFAGHGSLVAEFLKQAEPYGPEPSLNYYNAKNLQADLDKRFKACGFDKSKHCPPAVNIRACSSHKYKLDAASASAVSPV